MVKSANVVSPLLNRREAAAYLGLQPQTLAAWASAGRYTLPFVRIGSRVMYRRTDLDNFIEANSVGAPLEAAVG